MMKKNDYFLDVSGWQVADISAICAQAGTSKTIIKTTEGTTYFNTSAPIQVATSDCQGFYHFSRFGGNITQAGLEADYFLSTLPKKDVTYLVCDYEDDASYDKQSNTQAILHFMRKCKQAGYEPIYYSYKPYTLQYVNYQEIINEFPNSLWIAAYADYNVRPTPDGIWDIFPSMEGIRWWQFTSTALPGGLDKNIVLLDDDVKENKKNKEIKEDLENMNAVIRSKSGKQGYFGISNGKAFGIASIDTVGKLKQVGFVELTLDDRDYEIIFNRFK